MITNAKTKSHHYDVKFCKEKKAILSGKTFFFGTGEFAKNRRDVKEMTAKAAKAMKGMALDSYTMDLSRFYEQFGITCLYDAAEGVRLGTYEMPRFPEKERKEPKVGFTGIPDSMEKEAEEILKKSIVLTDGVIFARDLVNTPANHLRPLQFAMAVREKLKDTDAQVEILEAEKLKEMHMDALLAVGLSSEFLPCMLVVTYNGDPESKEVTALVGKGLTFDAGGYCLKPGGDMWEMKGDMGGGAAVAGALYSIIHNREPVNVVGIIPMCENRLSNSAMLPGDVISSYSGQTIEILNTDAEGRLVLADAVTYAVKDKKATRIIDAATLTGAIVRALGHTCAGGFSNDDAFYGELEAAAAKSGENYLRFPIMPEHYKMIESDVADMKNIGGDVCGAITAAAFIEKFAEKLPWIHLDIAGTAWVNSPVLEHQVKGATGAGVTTLYHLFTK